MKKNALKRIGALLLAVFLLAASLPVALATPTSVDYDVIVTASDNYGVNLREGPDTSYAKVRKEPIPMQARLHIDQEDTSPSGGKWGHTSYTENGTTWQGWIAMTEVSRVESTAKPAVSDGRMSAYRAIVQNAVDRYGVHDDEGCFSRGVLAAYCMDITGDGADELILSCAESDYEPELDNSNLTTQIYTYRGNAAEQVFEERGRSAFFFYTFYRDGSKVTFVTGSGRIAEASYYWNGNRLVTVTSDDFTAAEKVAINEASMGGLVAEEGAVMDCLLRHGGVNPDSMKKVFDIGAWMSPVGLSTEAGSVSVTDMLSTLHVSVPLKPEQLLQNIAYFGNRSKCKMDAKMANAYAQALEGLIAKYPAGAELKAVLADVADDGYPLLITGEGGYDDIGDLQIWEYRSGSAVSRDFSRDFSAFEWVSEIEEGTMAGQDAMAISLNQCGVIMPDTATLYYKVASGRLSLEHTEWYHTDANTGRYRIYLDGEDITNDDGADIPTRIDYTAMNTLAYSMDTGCFETAVSSAAGMATALRTYAQAGSAYSYPRVSETDEAELVNAIARAVADAVGGEITGIYELSDGVYYVIILVDGTEKGVLVKGCRSDGNVTWNVSQVDDQPLSQEQLDDLIHRYASTSNITLDYGKLSGSDLSTDEVIAYLQTQLDNMDGLAPNDAAKSELGAYIESAISATCSASVSGKDNRLTLDAEEVASLSQSAHETLQQYQALLDENDITLNKPIVVIIQILWKNMDAGSPCQITLDQSLAEALNGCSLRLLLGDGTHSVQVSQERLQTLLNAYGTVYIQISRSADGIYTVTFLDAEENVIDKLAAPIMMTLPASNLFSTIMVSYSQGSDNWGGQYDAVNGTIAFEALYSGQYQVIENSAEISDIADLPEEVRTAIAFLVSKGYMSLTDGAFDPDGTLSRYDFTQALVGMFFSLDRTLTTSFSDVPTDSPYYSYVASAEEKNIVEGIGDSTFGGEINMTVEQMLALAARTLMDQKGYTTPEDAAEYLASFEDAELISSWANDQVALAVREGVMDRGGMLAPQADITRAQAALILYRLFLLLYEVPPAPLNLPPEANASSLPIPAIAGGVGGIAAVLAVGGYFLAKKRKETEV